MRCARHQKYPNKELLVVSSGEEVADLVPPDVRHVHVPSLQTIGGLRNIGCNLAKGELVAHFDDDDFSHPARLQDQVSRLVDSGLAVTGYHSLLFTDGSPQWIKYTGASNYAVGTSLCYRRHWWSLHPFPAINVGEDNDFVYNAARHKQLISVDAGDLMFATTHKGNTSPRNMNKAFRPCDAPSYARAISQ